MKEVYPNIFVGRHEDLSAWSCDAKYLAACKEPCHRKALGYTTRGAPKDHPEYFYAYRGEGLILNLVDGDTPDWIDKGMIEAALNWITGDEPILIFCNQGVSRSATIALMWLVKNNKMSVEEFKKVYPSFQPSPGIKKYAEKYLEVTL